jgi:hypothetical protein
MADEPKKSRAPFVILAVVLLCALVGAWLVLRSQKTSNVPPVVALRLDSIDETNRVATLSDGGSHDPDGTLQSWRITWGDGQEQSLASAPQKAAHTYAAEGEYTISVWCIDNRGATSSVPAMTNITFDFLKRQKALEAARLKEEELRKQAEAKLEADRLKEAEARKQAERLEQEQQKQKELAAQEAQKAREQQQREEKRRAEEAELARQKAKEAATPPPTPLVAGVPGNPSARTVIYTPAGFSLGEFQIYKEKTEGRGNDGNFLVILIARCINFPNTAVPTMDWQIDGKNGRVQAGRIRASLSPGRHEVTALFKGQAGLRPKELKADITVQTNGDCVVIPRK